MGSSIRYSQAHGIGADDFDEILEIEKVPVHVGVVWPDAESATNCGRGDIRLAFCRECGFIYNVAFDERLIDYTLTYDNALGFSPTFQAYERDLCERLISKYDVRGKDVIELGAAESGSTAGSSSTCITSTPGRWAWIS